MKDDWMDVQEEIGVSSVVYVISYGSPLLPQNRMLIGCS